MRSFKCLLLGLGLLSTGLHAQRAAKASHDSLAEVTRMLYNQKQFDRIYALLSGDFKSAFKQADFTGFMANSLYSSFGEIGTLTYLADKQDFYAYLAAFKNGQLQMNLSVNTSGQIEGLQFVPWQKRSKTRQEAYLSDNKKQSRLDSAVDAAVQSFIQDPQHCGLSIGISKNGLNYFYNYGETKKNNKVLPGNNSIYEIGSITKTFCGLLLANAVVEKKMGLDDDVRRYLPGKYPNLAYDGTPILIKHLANHSSGLPGLPANLVYPPGFDSLNPYKTYSSQMLLDALKGIKPATEPGRTCSYSNMGMALLGIILEKVYGQPFETLVKEKICRPNGMSHTGINLDAAELAQFTDAYDLNGGPTPHWELNGFVAAGALRSSTADMLAYLNYNLAERDEAGRLAHRITYVGREQVALAWLVTKTAAGNTLTWHNGATYGSASFGGFIREKSCSVIILANSATAVDPIGIALLKILQE